MSGPATATVGADMPTNTPPEGPATANGQPPDSNVDIFEPFSRYLPTGTLRSVLTLPLQALAIVVLSRLVQEIVLCIDEVYEATGRRSRSKFASFPWIRITFGVIILAMYHFGLFKLALRSYRALRARRTAD